jgi:hypothetical protein
MIDMGCPCPIEWDQPASVYRPAEDVFWHKFALVPGNNLPVVRADTMVKLALPDVPEPFMIGVVCCAAMFQPLFDEHVGGIVVEGCLYKL